MEKKHGQNATWWQKSTNKGINYRSKNIKWTPQKKPESPTVTLSGRQVNTRYVNSPPKYIIKFKLRKMDVYLVEFKYLVFTRKPGGSCCRPLRSLLLCFCDVCQWDACWFFIHTLGLIRFRLRFGGVDSTWSTVGGRVADTIPSPGKTLTNTPTTKKATHPTHK